LKDLPGDLVFDGSSTEIKSAAHPFAVPVKDDAAFQTRQEMSGI